MVNWKKLLPLPVDLHAAVIRESATDHSDTSRLEPRNHLMPRQGWRLRRETKEGAGRERERQGARGGRGRGDEGRVKEVEEDEGGVGGDLHNLPYSSFNVKANE